MKTTAYNTLFFLLLIGTSAFAQYVGGGGTEQLKKPVKETGPWKTKAVICFGPSFPMGMWKQAPGSSATVSDAYTNATGFGAKTGFYGEVGNIFYLKKLALPENMGIAINAIYLNLYTNKFDWSSLGGNFSSSANTKFLFMSMKFGGQYTYNIVDKLFVDAYLNLCPTIASLGRVYTGILSTDYLYSVDANPTGYATGIRENIGFNIRYSVLTLGLDFIFGSLKQDVHTSIYNNKTGALVESYTTPTIFRANAMQLKIGFTL